MNTERLKETLCKELEELSRVRKVDMGWLETVHKITDTIKNIDKIEMLDESAGSYGTYGAYSADDDYGYGRMKSYGRMRRSYGADPSDMMKEKIEKMMQEDVDPETKMHLRKAMETLNK